MNNIIVLNKYYCDICVGVHMTKYLNNKNKKSIKTAVKPLVKNGFIYFNRLIFFCDFLI